MSIRVVVLIGPPGSGKTHIGQVLARALGWDFEDVERWLVDTYGSREAVVANKDAVLAALEDRYVERIAASDVPVVIESTGLSERDLLVRLALDHDVVFVRVSADADTCVRNVASRPKDANLNNDLDFTRSFAAELGNERLTDDEIIEVIEPLG